MREIDFWCPMCNVEPGEQCRTSKGKTYRSGYFHAARLGSYRVGDTADDATLRQRAIEIAVAILSISGPARSPRPNVSALALMFFVVIANTPRRIAARAPLSEAERRLLRSLADWGAALAEANEKPNGQQDPTVRY